MLQKNKTLFFINFVKVYNKSKILSNFQVNTIVSEKGKEGRAVVA